MKRLIGFISIIVVISLLCGCMPSVSLGNRAIVQAIGVDVNGDTVLSSVQCLNLNGEESIVFESQGKTLSDSLTKSMLQQGKPIFYGSNRAIIIGEDVVKNGLNKIHDFFNSDYHSRGNVATFISKSKATDIVKIESKDNLLPAHSVSVMAKNSAENGLYPYICYIDVLKNLANSGYTYIPVISKIKEEDSEKIICDGVAIITNNNLLGYISDSETEGLMFLIDGVNSRRLAFNINNTEKMTVDITKSTTDKNLKIQDGIPVFDIRIKTHATVSSVSTRDFTKPLNDTDITVAEKAMGREISKLCNSCIEKVVYEYGADIFGFLAMIKKYEYDYYKYNQEILGDIVKTVKINITVDCSIEKTGLSR